MTDMKHNAKSALEERLLSNWKEVGKAGYWAYRFYALFRPHCSHYIGGVKAVCNVIMKGQSAAFKFLVKHGRDDLLLEQIVLDDKWRHLFPLEVQVKARENLSRK
jgi:hypothetical protein